MSAERDREPLSTVPSPASAPAGAVFLSYASQDAAAAERIATALRNAGVEVWFDQSELRGGDAWDRSIRQQIHECRLFMPIVSAHTEARVEGYFRREWKLAVDRTHDLSDRVAFLVPVVIDSTTELKADVPDAFLHIQWTRLPGGEPSSAFVDRVRRLLSPDVSPGQAAAKPVPPGPHAVTMSTQPLGLSWRAALWSISAVLVVGLIFLIAERFWISKQSQAPAASNANAPPATAAVFNPPPHSVAVLPFVNMSGDASQEYFSDGLTEELLNSLSRINELQVAGRTSSFYFKGEHADLPTIAHKLNVASILEGSVRRSGQKVRVAAQLNNAVTGFHLWSQTYDRNLSDVLQLQTEIANAVANALKLTLLGNTAAKIEVGGTHNPAAFDAYLRASKAWGMQHGDEDMQAAIAAYDEAVRLDPSYALAYADRAMALAGHAGNVAGQIRHHVLDRAQSDARKAIELAPDLMESHRALAFTLEQSLDFGPAAKEYERALALNPGNARLLRVYGVFAVGMGWTDTGLGALRRGVVLDPLSRNQHNTLGDALNDARRYEESTAAYRDALTIDPDDSSSYINIGLNYFMLGDFQSAASWCEAKPAFRFSPACLAVVYDKLDRKSDAEAALRKFRASTGETYPYVLAMVYAQWGDAGKALAWLETAMRVRDPFLVQLKTDQQLDPLRKEPRFQAVIRELKFPD